MLFNARVTIETFKSFTQLEQLKYIGDVFDNSFDTQNIENIEFGLSLSKEIDAEELNTVNKSLYYYTLSNGWNYLRKLKFRGTEYDWNFHESELFNEILNLRKAVKFGETSDTPQFLRRSYFTNLGNTLSYIGRFVEAVEYWKLALEISPGFSIPLGNMANNLLHYGKLLYDETHRKIFICYSYNYIKQALNSSESLHPSAQKGFEEVFNTIRRYIINENEFTLPNLNDFDLGENTQLNEYRQWCLNNTLYINPLNDLGPFLIASHDCLSLPTLYFEHDEPPIYITLFNQIKQEYGTSRYSYYMSTKNSSQHFSDKDITLTDTYEEVIYSYYVEQLKISYRLSYSILDKISFLLNDYLKLLIHPSQVTFRSIWYEKTKKGKELILKEFFLHSQNWALRGLYWLSLDIFEKDLGSVLEPEAKEIAEIRNYIEHKAFKVHSLKNYKSKLYNPEKDIAFAISRPDFEDKTLKLLKLTRAAIIYLSLAIHIEEKKKDRSNTPSIPIIMQSLADYKRK